MRDDKQTLDSLRLRMNLLEEVMAIAARLCPGHLFEEKWGYDYHESRCVYCNYTQGRVIERGR